MQTMIKDKVSIIIPTYNRAKIIGRAIESVLRQTYCNFELIIVDDGSEDDTKCVVESYIDKRIKYYFKTNGGQNSALNYALTVCDGEFVAFCDSDDIWLSQKLERCVEKFRDDKCVSVVHHSVGVKLHNGEIICKNNSIFEGWCYLKVLENGGMTSPTFLMCRRECFDKIGEFDLKCNYCQDDDLCINLSKYYKIGYVNEMLAEYRLDQGDRMSLMKERVADSYAYLWDKHAHDIIFYLGEDALKKKKEIVLYTYFTLRSYKSLAYLRAFKREYGISIRIVRNILWAFVKKSDPNIWKGYRFD